QWSGFQKGNQIVLILHIHSGIDQTTHLGLAIGSDSIGASFPIQLFTVTPVDFDSDGIVPIVPAQWVLMTMDILIFRTELPLAPDDVTSKTIFTNLVTPGPRYSTKIVFDVTSSGANGSSVRKINMSIVISTLDNPNSESFREATFLSCARPCSTLSQTASYLFNDKIRWKPVLNNERSLNAR
ncbi:hypothetical protein PRIPAC_96291, partial [Pristionchus pacificus]|uniref:Uncharacterized protein n=1 Tax=Pristionchus pacificus TaxID=54126 RepID=A0A2A6D3G4_PRIPA